MKNKKGYTLIELVVVIAIMAVVLSAVGFSISTVFNNRSKSAARILYNTIGAGQNIGMSKENAYIAVNGDDNEVFTAYIVVKKNDGTYSVVQEEDLGKVKINFKVNGSYLTRGSNVTVIFHVDRATGKFDKIYTCYGQNWDTMYLMTTCTSNSHIEVEGNGGYDIVLSWLSGKYFYNN